MNEVAIFGDKIEVIAGLFAAHQPSPSERREAMNNAQTAIIIAIGGMSLVCLLVSRMQGRRRHLRRSHDGVGSDGGYYAGNDIGSLFGSTGTHNSISDSAASGHSAGFHDASSRDAGSAGDSGGGDSGGGGDGGGGGSD
jgi:hypothetical protein